MNYRLCAPNPYSDCSQVSYINYVLKSANGMKYMTVKLIFRRIWRPQRPSLLRTTRE
jgi:hypothetical protein